MNKQLLHVHTQGQNQAHISLIWDYEDAMLPTRILADTHKSSYETKVFISYLQGINDWEFY